MYTIAFMYAYIYTGIIIRYAHKYAYICIRMFSKYARLYEYVFIKKMVLAYEYRILDICVLMYFMWNVLC